MTVNWKGLGKKFWLPFASMDLGKRRKFLKEHNLQYKDIPKCRKCHQLFFRCKCGDTKFLKELEQKKNRYRASFQDKLKYSRKLAEKVLKEHKGEKIILAYSSGIDSECCVQLFKDAIKDGRVQLLFNITGVNFPEAYERVKELEKDFNINILRVKPPKGTSFKMIVQKYGLPIYGRSSSDKKKRMATVKCCKLLKKKPTNSAIKDIDVFILGLRMDENRSRSLTVYHRGDYFFAKGYGRWHIYPIAYWTIEDVWEFQKLEGFKYNKLYDLTNYNKIGSYKLYLGDTYQIRTGCWCCPQAFKFGYLEWLEKYHPRFYKALMETFGLRNHPAFIIWEKKKKIMKRNYKPCGVL